MKTILAIDDKKDNLTTITAVVKSNMPGCKVLTALSGKEGIDIAQKEQPDTILLDIIMPVMDGYEVCRGLKVNELTKHIPVVMLTAISTDTKSRVKGLDIGADAFLSKPIDPVELTAQINVMLRIKEAEDKLRTDKKNLENVVLDRTKKLIKINKDLEIEISEHKLARKKLLENQYYLKKAQEIGIIGTWELDIQRNILTWTDENYKIFGVPVGKPMNYEQFLDCVHPDDRNYVHEKWSAALNNEPYDIEHRMIVDGNLKWVREKADVEFDIKGNPVVAIGFTQDISIQKMVNLKLTESEERFRQITTNSQEWIWEVDSNGLYTFASKVMEDMLGFNCEEIVGKKHFYDLFLPAEREELKKFAFEAFKQKLPFRDFLNRNVTKNGDIVWLSTSGIPILDANGNLRGYRGADNNVTEIKLNENLAAAQLGLIEYSNNHTIEELLQKFLDEAEILTDSKIGFYHFLEDDEETILLQAWSTNTLNYMCKGSEDAARHYPISQAGVWIDCIHDRQPVIHNNYANLHHKKGLPEGHAPIIRELVVPVIRGEKIRAILGLGNKDANYNQTDVKITQQLADVAWETVVRMRAEEALRSSEELNRSITQTAISAIISVNSDGIIHSWNNAAEKIFGYSYREMINNNLLKIIPKQHQSLFYTQLESLKNGNEEMISGKSLELTALRKDGSEFPVELSLSIWESNKQRFYTGIFNDITERKRAEQIQKVLYNISRAVITSDDLKNLIGNIQIELGTIVDTTNFYVALYDPVKDNMSLPFFADEKDNFTTIPAGKTMTYYVYKTQKSLLVTSEKFEELLQSGDIEDYGARQKIWLGVPLGVEGKTIGVIAVQSYTNENAYNKDDLELLEFIADHIGILIVRKKAEQDLIKALEKATESDRLKSAFLASMSHEIRTPLNSIVGFSNIIAENMNDPKMMEFSTLISDQNKLLLNLINDILEFAKVEAGGVEIINKKLDLNIVLDELFLLFYSEFSSNKILIPKKISDSVYIHSDELRVKQIFTNLINNALKFTPKGEIYFGIERIGKSEITCFVRDTGIGISKENQEKIFERFTKLDPFTQGTGLGLPIVKNLIELLDGKLWLESASGKGSCFYFTLPKNTGKLETLIEKPEKESIRLKNNLETDKILCTVLIAEDNMTNYLYIREILTNSNVRIIHVLNGYDAVECVKTNSNIDVVLMDIKMPVMNGYEATQQIKKIKPQIPVIALTAFVLPKDRIKAKKAGCDDYITKPINRMELIEKIKNFIGENRGL